MLFSLFWNFYGFSKATDKFCYSNGLIMLEKTLLKLCFVISIIGIIALFVITVISEEKTDSVTGVIKRSYFDGEKSYLTIALEVEKVVTIEGDFAFQKGKIINASGLDQGDFFNAHKVSIVE